MSAPLEALSVPTYLETVLRLASSWRNAAGSEIWYRGVRSRGHDLVPGAVWRTNCDGEGLFNSFRARARTLLDPVPADEWEWYFAAQHYGLPTRLLDWTESPLVALWFAVNAAEPGDDPVVWMLDPADLNRRSVDYAHPLAPGGELTRYWLPSNVAPDEPVEFTWSRDGRARTNSAPIAIDPRRATARIIAQMGTFTVHGAGRASITSLFEPASDRLRSIDLQDARRIRTELLALGFDRFALFPEPESLAASLRDWYETRP